MHVAHLPTDHPWYFLNRWGTPNVKWCEATVHSWAAEPANTWSNLAFFVVAYLIFRALREESSRSTLANSQFPSKSDRHSDLWVPGVVVLGLGSGLFHASSTFFFQVADFFGMFLVFLIPLFINLQRLAWVGANHIRRYYFLAAGLATVAVPLLVNTSFPIQGLVGFIALAIISTEILLWKKTPPARRPKLRPLWICAGLLFIAGVASVSDLTRVFCDPENHWVQGHAIWHLFSSSAIYFSYQYYRQFEPI